MKNTFLLLAALLLAACGTTTTKNWKAQHVIFVGLDGWGSYSAAAADMPNVKKMMAQGASTLRKRTVLPSSSAPNWASMFMGAGTELHGYTEWGTRVPNPVPRDTTHYGMFPSIFGILRDAYPSAEIGCLHEWDGIRYLVEQQALNYSQQAKKDSITMLACEYIRAKKPTLFAIIYDDPDHVGHAAGHDTPEYYEELKSLDAKIGEIVQAVQDAGIFDETIFIVTSDHGGINKGHGGKTMMEMETPFIVCGKNIRHTEIAASVVQYDVAATMAAIFGLQQPQVWTGRAMDVFEK